MGFNADDYLKAREAWTLTLGGRTYTAAWVSVEQYLDYEAARKAAKTEAEHRQAAALVLRAMFPARLSYLWRGDPAAKVLQLDAPAIGQILSDFFGWWWAKLIPSTKTTPSSPAPSPASAPSS